MDFKQSTLYTNNKKKNPTPWRQGRIDATPAPQPAQPHQEKQQPYLPTVMEQ